MRVRNLPMDTQSGRETAYLTEEQVNALVEAFQTWYDEAPTDYARKTRGRYWLTFLVLRFTGARLGEVLLIDDTRDVDHRAGELRLATLKRKRPKRRAKQVTSDIPHPRQIPVPMSVTSEIASYQAQFPEMRGEVFKLQPGNFLTKFYEMAARAGIVKELGHPQLLWEQEC